MWSYTKMMSPIMSFRSNRYTSCCVADSADALAFHRRIRRYAAYSEGLHILAIFIVLADHSHRRVDHFCGSSETCFAILHTSSVGELCCGPCAVVLPKHVTEAGKWAHCRLFAAYGMLPNTPAARSRRSRVSESASKRSSP